MTYIEYLRKERKYYLEFLTKLYGIKFAVSWCNTVYGEILGRIQL